MARQMKERRGSLQVQASFAAALSIHSMWLPFIINSFNNVDSDADEDEFYGS